MLSHSYVTIPRSPPYHRLINVHSMKQEGSILPWRLTLPRVTTPSTTALTDSPDFCTCIIICPPCPRAKDVKKVVSPCQAWSLGSLAAPRRNELPKHKKLRALNVRRVSPWYNPWPPISAVPLPGYGGQPRYPNSTVVEISTHGCGEKPQPPPSTTATLEGASSVVSPAHETAS